MRRRTFLQGLGVVASQILVACETVPIAARDLWIRMAEVARGQPRPPEFLSTHPADVTRIRRIEQWLPEALQYYDASPYRS